MSKYRARVCPSCHYYIVFCVAPPMVNDREACVAGFCLNCNYTLPVRSIIRGLGRVTSPLRRGALRLARIAMPGQNRHPSEPRGTPEKAKLLISSSEYSRHLRVIGQDLENHHYGIFNLECTADSYLVWPRSYDVKAGTAALSFLTRTRFQKWWQHRAEPKPQGRREFAYAWPYRRIKRYRYLIEDLDRMELAARRRRNPSSPAVDGHGLSQLLRTVGTLVGQKGARLLGISWQNLSVNIVVETAGGRREVDVYRHDNLYDLWVAMYLRRENRALSDVPR